GAKTGSRTSAWWAAFPRRSGRAARHCGTTWKPVSKRCVRADGSSDAARSTDGAQILRDLGAANVFGPVERRSVVDRIAEIQPRAPFHKKAHDVRLVGRDG